MEDENNHWALLKAGDQQSFEAIYKAFYQDLVHYAYRFDNDPNFTDECIQDLFVKIWQNRENLGYPVSVKFYLLKALKHIIYNKKNQKSNEVNIGLLSDFSEFQIIIEEGQNQALSERLTSLMGSLTDRQREAVYLFYYQDFGYQQIAEILEINIGGVYKLIYRALDVLRSYAKVGV